MNVKTRPFTPAEIQLLISYSPSPWKEIYTVAYCTALRVSDIINLPPVQNPHGLTVKEKKTGHLKTIHASPALLRAWDYLIRKNCGPFLISFRDSSTFRKAIQRHCRDLGISVDRVAFHSLRKTAATSIYHNFGLMAANQWLGHTKMSTTMKYIEEDSILIANSLDISIQLAGIPEGGVR